MPEGVPAELASLREEDWADAARLCALENMERQIVLWHDEDGAGFDDIASEIGWSVSRVRRAYCDAKDFLEDASPDCSS